MRRFLHIITVITALASAARADLVLTLATSEQAAVPGAELRFDGTLTNTSATDKIFLNDVQATLTGGAAVHLALKTNTFFSSVPGILLPGETYSGPLFRIKLSSAAPAVNYSGVISLHGGASIIAMSDLTSSSITLRAQLADQWRYQTFGSAANDPAAADTADWDHDGLKNLLEYALQLDAKAASTSGLPQPVVLDDHLTLSYVPTASDIIYEVEASTDLTNWSTEDVEPVAVPNPAPPGRLTFRYTHPLATAGKVFLRLRMTRQ